MNFFFHFTDDMYYLHSDKTRFISKFGTDRNIQLSMIFSALPLQWFLDTCFLYEADNAEATLDTD